MYQNIKTSQHQHANPTSITIKLYKVNKERMQNMEGLTRRMLEATALLK